MAKVVPVLNTAKPVNALALWMSIYTPDIFAAAFKKVQRARAAAKIKPRIGRLADDDDDDIDFDDSDDSDDSTDFVPTTDFSLDQTDSGADNVLLDTSGTDSTASADETLFGNDFGDAGLDAITVDDTDDLSSLDPSLVTDQTSTGAAVLNAAAAAPTSTGTTIGSLLASAATTVLQGVASVGQSLSTPQALTSLAQTASAYYAAQNNATAAQLIATQIALAAAGQPVAPITYTTDPATGQQIPSLATTAANGQVQYTPLTTAQLAQLQAGGVSSLQKWGVWIAAGAAIVLLVVLTTRNRGQGP